MTKILNETCQRGGLWSPGIGGSDSYSIAIPSGEVYYGARVTILSGDQQAQASISTQPSPGQTGSLSLTVGWKCGLPGMIQYQVEAFSTPSTTAPSSNVPSPTAQMTGFLPSVNGFHFDNSFPAVPDLVFHTPLGDIKIGDASNGLCGGMVFTALDYFNAGLAIPPDSTPPSSGELFDYIVKRLFTSFSLPTGVLKYVELMNPRFPAGQMQFGIPGLAVDGRAWIMIRQEWPAIKQKLDTGQACPLGLIKVISGDLSQLGQNHQVLAYGYDLKDDILSLFIADPNYHDDDTITLKLSLADPLHAASVTYSTGESVYCFFHTNYVFTMPPGETFVPGRLILFEAKDFGGQMTAIENASPDLRVFQREAIGPLGSSFIILGGNWSFYRSPQFANPFLHGTGPLVLGPGSYQDAQNVGIQDNGFLSLKAVSASPNS